MTNPENLILFLLGTLQLIAIGISTWTLTTVIRLLQRTAMLEGKFDSFPHQQIANNRHRIEQLEKHQETVLLRMSTVEKVIDSVRAFCNKNHMGNI